MKSLLNNFMEYSSFKRSNDRPIKRIVVSLALILIVITQLFLTHGVLGTVTINNPYTKIIAGNAGEIQSGAFQGENIHREAAIFANAFHLAQAPGGVSGEMVVLDFNNYRARLIKNNIITTVMGNGQYDTTPDGIAPDVAQGGSPLKAITSAVFDLNGDLIFCERDNYVVRKLNLSTRKLETIAGILGSSANPNSDPFEGVANETKIGNPYSVAIDSQGDIIIGTYPKYLLRLRNNTLTKIAGGGNSPLNSLYTPMNALQVYLGVPNTMTVTPEDDIIFLTQGNNYLYKYINATGELVIIAQTPTGSEGLENDGEYVYVADPCRVIRYNITGTTDFEIVVGVSSSVDNGCTEDVFVNNSPLNGTYLSQPRGLLFADNYKTLYIAGEVVFKADLLTQRISVYSGRGVSKLSYNLKALDAYLLDATSIYAITNSEYYVATKYSILRIYNGIVENIMGSYDGIISSFRTALGSSKMRNNRMITASPDGPIDGYTHFPGAPVGMFVTYDREIYYFEVMVAVGTTTTLSVKLKKIKNGILSTVAGVGTPGHTGDGGSALDAQINSGSIYVTRKKEIYFTEYPSYIRHIDTNGVIRTIAGKASGGLGCDFQNYEATQCSVVVTPYPNSITVDETTGDVYFMSKGPYDNVQAGRADSETGTCSVRRLYTYTDPSTLATERRLDRAAGSSPSTDSNGEDIHFRLATFVTPKSFTRSPTGEMYILTKLHTPGKMVLRLMYNDSPNPLIRTYAGTGTNVAPTIAQFQNHTIQEDATLVNMDLVSLSTIGGEIFAIDSTPTSSSTLYKTSVVRYISPHFTCFGSISGTCGNGYCSATDTCTCYYGWEGTLCNIPLRCGSYLFNETNVCGGSSRGSCASLNNCQCNTGFYGDSCELHSCNGVLSNDTNVCSSHGSCNYFSSNNTASCSCNSPYFSSDCSLSICNGLVSNNATVCSNGNGTCVGGACQCNSDRFGNDCELVKCFGILSNDSSVCGGKGACIDTDQCECQNDYYGDDCRVTECFGILSNSSQVCSGGSGSCISVDSCSCNSTYYGQQCENSVTCNGVLFTNASACSGFGQCISNNTCSCQTGYSGSTCSVIKCLSTFSNDSSSCNGNGQCLTPDTCSCNSGYYGQNCSVIKCFSTFNNDSSSCSGNGQCLTPDVCTCNSGYYGQNCSVIKCLSTFSNDSSSCSGNGQCLTPDSCSCNSGYYGQTCSVIKCYSTFNNDSSSCNGNGQCLTPDTCSCNSGWHGPQCSLTTCFGVESNNSLVCSSNGACQSLDTCSCISSRFGVNCDLFKCNNKLSNDSSVCSSHGTCLNNVCQCTSQYTGSNCETLVQSNSNNGNSSSSSNSSNVSNVVVGRIEPPVKFTDFGDGFTFKFYTDNSQNSTIPCDQLFPNSILILLGTDPVCEWIDLNNGLFKVKFGRNPTISKNVTISYNLNALNPGQSANYSSPQFNVEQADNPIPPSVSIKRKNIYGSDEDIVLDASESYSGDKSDLTFEWSSTPNISVIQSQANAPIIVIPKEQVALLPDGSYNITLRVTSKFLGIPTVITFVFEKKNQELCKIEINGPSKIVLRASDLPFTIYKSSSTPSTDASSPIIEWKQISNTEPVTFTTDSNQNLIIKNFTRAGVNQLHEFEARIHTANNPLVISSRILIRQSPSAQGIDFTTSLTSTGFILNVNVNDPDDKLISTSIPSSTRTWTCQLVNTQGQYVDCSVSILNKLSTVVNTLTLTTAEFGSDIESIELGLSVSKGDEKTNTKFFSVNIPRKDKTYVEVLTSSKKSVSTVGNDMISKGDKYSVQLDTSLNGQDNSENVERQWTLNGKTIPTTFLKHMKAGLNIALSNSLVIDTSQLDEGSINTIEVTITDKTTLTKTTQKFTFGILVSPVECKCSVSPKSGKAVTTKFSFSCSNCQNEQGSLKFEFGFVHPVSGILIPTVVNGTVLSQILPVSSKAQGSESRSVYYKITDSITKSESIQYETITIDNTVTNVNQSISDLQPFTTKISSTLTDGNIVQSVHNLDFASQSFTSILKNLLATNPSQALLDTLQSNNAKTASETLQTSLVNKMNAINTAYKNDPLTLITSSELNMVLEGTSSLLESCSLLKLSNETCGSAVDSLSFMETIISKAGTSQITQAHHDLVQTILNNLYLEILKVNSNKVSLLTRLFKLTEQCLDLLVYQINVGEKNMQLSLKYGNLIGNKQWKNSIFPLSETLSISDQSSKSVDTSFVRSTINLDQPSKSTPLSYRIQSLDDTTVQSAIVTQMSPQLVLASDTAVKIDILGKTSDSSTVTSLSNPYVVTLPFDSSLITTESTVNCYVIESFSKLPCENTVIHQSNASCVCSKLGSVVVLSEPKQRAQTSTILVANSTIATTTFPLWWIAVIIGIILVVVIVIVVVVVIVVVMVRKKKKNKVTPKESP